MLNQQQLDEILNLLKNHRELSMKKIAAQYHVSVTTIRAINQGVRYVQSDIQYPIRTKEESNKALLTGTKSSCAKLNEQQIQEIVVLIQSSSLPFTGIAKQYNVSSSTIGLINQGKRYHNDNLNYPLRKYNKNLL